LGLLAILALGGRRGVSRDRIEAYLWPESSAARARHSLDQVVYAIRQALGSDSIVSTGRELRLNPEFVRADIWEFEDAIRAGQWAAAVGHYKGPLLDGFHFADSRELESWIDTERARLLQSYQTAVERLANLSAEAGDHSQGISWWRRLANSDPLSAGLTKKLMLALAAAGDRAGAVKHARNYQELVRQELEMEPDPEIEGLASTFSQPGITATVGPARRRPPTVVSSPPADTPIPVPREGGLGATGLRALSPQNPLRTKRWRIAAGLSLSVLIALLIGAVTVERRTRDHPSLAQNTARSRIALPAARDSYLRGLNAWTDGSKEGLDTAVVYFRRATELDPEYAEAYAGLADAYVMLGYFGYRPREEMFPKAKAAALRSMQLDSTLASAHPALAYELTWERDFAGANAEFRKATASEPSQATAQARASDPTYAMAHQWYAILLMILAQKPEAAAASRRAANQDIFSLSVPITELTFEKWFTTYPAMTGNTSYGPGTIAGEVLSRIDDGVSTHMVARYELTDPSGAHSFKAVIQGKADNKTGMYALNGIVTWGWMLGAHVHVVFQRITPCQFGKLNVCFQGTIQIQRG
jgi:DNA-binding SARP family transcriptional activator